jgi:hypothetical protein
MVPVVQRICHMDSQDVARPIFHPHVATSSIFQHNQCCRGGGQAHSTIGTTACTDSSRQSSLIRTLQQISPDFFSQLIVHTEASLLFPPKHHKLTLVAPPSMRDDLHSYILPLLLQLFRILNVCLNRIFEEFILFIFSQVVESL